MVPLDHRLSKCWAQISGRCFPNPALGPVFCLPESFSSGKKNMPLPLIWEDNLASVWDIACTAWTTRARSLKTHPEMWLLVRNMEMGGDWDWRRRGASSAVPEANEKSLQGRMDIKTSEAGGAPGAWSGVGCVAVQQSSVLQSIIFEAANIN